jgi:hypothetical protein
MVFDDDHNDDDEIRNIIPMYTEWKWTQKNNQPESNHNFNFGKLYLIVLWSCKDGCIELFSMMLMVFFFVENRSIMDVGFIRLVLLVDLLQIPNHWCLQKFLQKSPQCFNLIWLDFILAFSDDVHSYWINDSEKRKLIG